MFSWIAQVAALGPVPLTVRAQLVSPADAGRLVYPTFFPRVDVNSVKIADISSVDYRPVADRRDWGQQGRLVPLKTPNLALVEMIPVESYLSIGEREIQALSERTGGNEQLFRQQIGADIPARIDGERGLAAANFRRLEIDALRAWALGTITVRNPQGTGADSVVNLGFAGDRYVTAATAWNDAGVNAFDLFIQSLEAAEDKVGLVGGAIMRRADFNDIAADAPRLAPEANILPGVTQVLQRVRERVGRPNFQFFIHEESLDVFSDGGTATVREKVWPANRVAFIPEGFQVGSTYHAPVARAFDIARSAPANARIDVRGNTVYTSAPDMGKQLIVQAQINALSIPDESRVYVVKTTP